MNNRSKILIVDDDKGNCKRLNKLLSVSYKTQCANSGKECLTALESFHPDLCLLDIVLPDMDGYEICQHIRKNPKFSETVIIFVSGRLSTESIIKGYECGANDYITKPINDIVLAQKVDLNLKSVTTERELREEVKLSTNTAFTAMRETSDYGQLINFMRDSLECTSYEALTEQVFKITDEMQLNATLKLYTATGELDMNPSGISRPLESELLTRCRNQGRFFDFQSRTIINFDHVSVLIKNMPINDKEKYGRVRDMLATLLTAVNAQVNILDQIKRSETLHDSLLHSTIQDVHGAMQQIEATTRSQEQRSMKTMDGLIHDMEGSMMSIDLTDAQESSLLTILKKAAQEMSHIYENSLDIDNQFNSVMKKMSKLIMGQGNKELNERP